eukprot:589-Rhodomonas_salina.3
MRDRGEEGRGSERGREEGVREKRGREGERGAGAGLYNGGGVDHDGVLKVRAPAAHRVHTACTPHLSTYTDEERERERARERAK